MKQGNGYPEKEPKKGLKYEDQPKKIGKEKIWGSLMSEE